MPSRRRALLRPLIIGPLTLFGGAVLVYGWIVWSYSTADTEYRRLSSLRPKTCAEVDGILSRWPHRGIDKSESEFGRLTALTGEYEQYTVLGWAQIDVVYDESHRVVMILPSYE